jgi:hypothetical protein
LYLNDYKIKGAQNTTNIKMHKNSKLTINNDFRLYHSADICLFEGAHLKINGGYANFGCQIRCKKSITIGKNVAIVLKRQYILAG